MVDATWRLAEMEDVCRIDAMIRRSVATLHDGHYDAAVLSEAIERYYGVDQQLIEDRTYHVVEASGVIAGSGGWSRRKSIGGAHAADDGGEALLDPETDAAHIRALFVDPSFTRRGLGELVLGISEDAARDAGFSRISLLSTLPPVRFYASRGYRHIRRVDVPLPSGALLPFELMEKSLR